VVARPAGPASQAVINAAKAYVDANLKYGSSTIPPVAAAQDTTGCLSVINNYIDNNWPFDASATAACNTCTPKYNWTSLGLYVGDTNEINNRIVPASMGAQVAKDRVATDMICAGKHVSLPSPSTNPSSSATNPSPSPSPSPPPSVAGKTFVFSEREYDSTSRVISYSFEGNRGHYSDYSYLDSSSQEYDFTYTMNGNIVSIRANGGTVSITYNPRTYCLTNGSQTFCPP
jgi:hypothetical protein